LDFAPNERVLSFQVPDVCAKFCRNRFKIATVRARTDTLTDTQSDLIISLMLCYSNGTDNESSSLQIRTAPTKLRYIRTVSR